MNIFIAGAGTMGAGIAETFLAYGHDVHLYDTIEAAVASGKHRIETSLDHQCASGLLSPELKGQRLARFHSATTLDAALHADLVIEAVFECMDVKHDILLALDELCPPTTLFASNTSALSITEMSYGLSHAPQMCGMHFFNPAPQTQLVEIVAGLLTAPATLSQVEAIAHSIGKETVRVEEYAGFIVNRLLIPQINEAIFMLMEGVATAEDIDRAMIGAAHHAIGPLHLADQLGNDHVLQVLENLHADTGDNRYRPCPLLRKMVRAGRLGQKTARGFFDYSQAEGALRR